MLIYLSKMRLGENDKHNQDNQLETPNSADASGNPLDP